MQKIKQLSILCTAWNYSFFLYKNLFYTNAEAENLPKFKKMLELAEAEETWRMFVLPRIRY